MLERLLPPGQADRAPVDDLEMKELLGGWLLANLQPILTPGTEPNAAYVFYRNGRRKSPITGR